MQSDPSVPETGRKSDGADGPPLVAPPANTPGKPNAALLEAPPKPNDGVRRDHACAAGLMVADAQAGEIVAADGKPRRKSIAICGFAASTRALAPFEDPQWEIWGLNQLYRHIPRADAWFDIHHNWDREVVPGTDHRAWAANCGIPFYLHHLESDVPTAVRYPVERLIKYFDADYFTSTIAYMLALSIWEIDRRVAIDFNASIQRYARQVRQRKAPKDLDFASVQKVLYSEYAIGLFGIDLVVGGEYFHEKPCAEFWIGHAVGRGITVRIPEASALCKQRFRYGYDPEPGALIKLGDFEEHQKMLHAQRDEKFKELCMLEGAIQNDEIWRQTLELRGRGAGI